MPAKSSRPIASKPAASKPATSKPVTLKEVARYAEVSPMTVSNYVNGRHDVMSDEVRDRVAKAVEVLKYRRNQSARKLRTAESLSVGMIIVDNSATYLADGYTTQLVAGASNHLTEHGFSLFLQGIRPDQFEASPLIRNIQTDGLCVMLSGDKATRSRQFEILRDLRQPLVVFMESFDSDEDTVCCILQDEFAAGRELGRHLLGGGASGKLENVAILVPKLNHWAAVAERERGMRAALEPAVGAEGVRTLACGDGSFTAVQDALSAYLDRSASPDCLLAINDQMAIAAMKVLQSRGVRVPQEVRITGFNAFELHRFSDPELTTVRSPAYEMGLRGAEALLACLREGQFRERKILFPYELLIGAST